MAGFHPDTKSSGDKVIYMSVHKYKQCAHVRKLAYMSLIIHIHILVIKSPIKYPNMYP